MLTSTGALRLEGYQVTLPEGPSSRLTDDQGHQLRTLCKAWGVDSKWIYLRPSRDQEIKAVAKIRFGPRMVSYFVLAGLP